MKTPEPVILEAGSGSSHSEISSTQEGGNNMYGPRYEFAHESRAGERMSIAMRPAQDGDPAAFAPMMSDPAVQAYLGRQTGQTIRDEEEFFDRMRTDKDSYLWVIEVTLEGAGAETIGCTSLHTRMGNRFGSGYVCGRPEYWNRGIASATHRLRTWYAFCERGAYAIDSSYADANEFSGRALRGVGYLEVGRRPRSFLRGGRWHDEVLLSCYNPAATGILWPEEGVPAAVREALPRTESALESARQLLALPRS